MYVTGASLRFLLPFVMDPCWSALPGLSGELERRLPWPGWYLSTWPPLDGESGGVSTLAALPRVSRMHLSPARPRSSARRRSTSTRRLACAWAKSSSVCSCRLWLGRPKARKAEETTWSGVNLCSQLSTLNLITKIVLISIGKVVLVTAIDVCLRLRTHLLYERRLAPSTLAIVMVVVVMAVSRPAGAHVDVSQGNARKGLPVHRGLYSSDSLVVRSLPLSARARAALCSAALSQCLPD